MHPSASHPTVASPANSPSATAPLDLTIVIVNWNGGELLQECLASIRRCRTPRRVSTIVVDNASADGSRERAEREFPEMTILNSGSNLGFAKGNNYARPHIQTALVLLLNPDTVLLEDSLTKMIEFMEQHPDVGALGCKMRYPTGEIQEQGLQWFPTPATEFINMVLVSADTFGKLKHILPQLYLDPHRSADVKKLYGGCLVLRKDLLDRIGWLDERYFMYAEDVDLCRTVLAAGYRVHYQAEAEIIHVAGGLSRRAAGGFSTLMKCESIGKYMLKYYGSFGLFRYRVALIAGSLLRLVMLGTLRVVSAVLPIGRSIDYQGSNAKYRRIIRWCLGREKPFIPTHRAERKAAVPA